MNKNKINYSNEHKNYLKRKKIDKITTIFAQIFLLISIIPFPLKY